MWRSTCPFPPMTSAGIRGPFLSPSLVEWSALRLGCAGDPPRDVAQVAGDRAELAGDAFGAQTFALGDLGHPRDALAEAGALGFLVTGDASDALGALGGRSCRRYDHVEGAERRLGEGFDVAHDRAAALHLLGDAAHLLFEAEDNFTRLGRGAGAALGEFADFVGD